MTSRLDHGPVLSASQSMYSITMNNTLCLSLICLLANSLPLSASAEFRYNPQRIPSNIYILAHPKGLEASESQRQTIKTLGNPTSKEKTLIEKLPSAAGKKSEYLVHWEKTSGGAWSLLELTQSPFQEPTPGYSGKASLVQYDRDGMISYSSCEHKRNQAALGSLSYLSNCLVATKSLCQTLVAHLGSDFVGLKKSIDQCEKISETQKEIIKKLDSVEEKEQSKKILEAFGDQYSKIAKTWSPSTRESFPPDISTENPLADKNYWRELISACGRLPVFQTNESKPPVSSPPPKKSAR